jgi:hypothetical protein
MNQYPQGSDLPSWQRNTYYAVLTSQLVSLRVRLADVSRCHRERIRVPHVSFPSFPSSVVLLNPHAIVCPLWDMALHRIPHVSSLLRRYLGEYTGLPVDQEAIVRVSQ